MSTQLLQGDCRVTLPTLPDKSVQACITSPPYYGLRSYIADGDPLKPFEIGLEPTPELYIEHMVEVFREVRRVLRDDGLLWLNLGDSYATSGTRQGNVSGGIRDIGVRDNHRSGYRGKPAGIKEKDLLMMPFRVAMALQADGWWLRSVIPWLKRNSMPESVTDRPSTSVEYIFLLAKSARYYWDADRVRVNYNSDSIGRYRTSMQATAPTSRQPGGDIDRKIREQGVRDPNTSARARRNSDWFFESWQGLLLDEQDAPLSLVVNPQPLKLAHFATFPPKLVEPMIKASTSERGQCPECGAPWVRVVERGDLTPLRGNSTAGPKARGQPLDGIESKQAHYERDGWMPGVRNTQTVGWQPSCAHTAEPVPQTVLDPFFGAGTVGLVADRFGRNAIGGELKPDYAAMGSDRIVGDAPLFAELL